jgi:hypothetical protein
MPTIRQLVRRHPEHQKFYDRWRLLDAMAAGGSCVNESVKKQLLVCPDREGNDDVVSERIKLAPYDSVMGGILVKLISQLMQDEASYQGSNDPFWADEFLASGALVPEDDDAAESFHSFLTQSAFQGLVQGAAIAQIDTRNVQANTLNEQRGAGGDRPYVILRPRTELWDWQIDRNGYQFAKLHTYQEIRQSWDSDPVEQHQFTIYWRDDNGRVYGAVWAFALSDSGRRKYPELSIHDFDNLTDEDVNIHTISEETEIFNINRGGQRIYKFPIVSLRIPPQLWLTDQLFDLQKSLFNQVASGEWAILQTNYAQLVFTGIEKPHSESNSNPAKESPAGDGYYWELGPDQDAKWLVRDSEGIELCIDYQEKIRKRMLEIIHRIAESAASDYAARMQSGESKKEQRKDLDILLDIYGGLIRDYAARILNVASIAHNEDVDWNVRGFSDYNSEGLIDYIDKYLQVQKTNINSASLNREAQRAIAARTIQELGLDANLLSQVEAEIAQEPFALDEKQLDSLVRVAQNDFMTSQSLLVILQKAGLIPADLDVAAESARLSTAIPSPTSNGNLSAVAPVTVPISEAPNA